MTHYFIELALWMIATFLVGCVIGWLAKRMFGTTDVAVESRQEAPLAVAAPTSPPIGAAPPAPPARQWQPAAATGKIMPIGLPAARNGRADDLQRISGVGEKYERTLNALGFYHFDQIAAWNASEMDWMDDYLQFNGRIRRENWIEQCELLATGQEEEFARLYGTGGLRNDAGDTEAGLRTRRS
jgi:predicted flap endonuclease-1-like 5' DNA nuclease